MKRTRRHLARCECLTVSHTRRRLSHLLPPLTSKLIPDHLTPTPSHLLSTTLSDLLHTHMPSSPRMQTPPQILPQGHHLVYFPLQTAASQLAPDGADPDHSPSLHKYPRRLWAGGSVTFRAGWQRKALLDGRAWQCREDIRGVRVHGAKAFVDVQRRYGDGEEDCIDESRTLVFMPAATTGQSTRRASPNAKLIQMRDQVATYSVQVVPTATHLFHFSALTYNAHAVHVDAERARAEGHKAMLVHGPLTLALMLQVLQRDGPVAELTYRNHAPLHVDEVMRVCVGEGKGGRERAVWVEGPEGGLAVRGRAVMEEEDGE